jgi:hypothetical protein
MPLTLLLIVGSLLTVVSVQTMAQDLDPRAYVRVPVDITIMTAGVSYSDGSIVTDPTVPLEDFRASVTTATIGLGRTFDLFGTTAQVFVAQPYSLAQASATVMGNDSSITRSGLADLRVRFSTLIVGAPARTMSEFATVPRQTILGVSLMMVAPVGQFMSDKLINIGTNRWAFKPEIALSQPFGEQWLVDVYAGAWFFTDNPTFFPGTALREQDPMAAVQAHVSYTFAPGLWAALNTTYYVGGASYVNGQRSPDEQNNVRAGVTAVMPITPMHSLKFAASTGAIIRAGANFTTVSLAWQGVF